MQSPDPTQTLDGPRHGPEAGGKVSRLVVFLHGLGADGNDLISLAPILAPLLPETAFVSPDAPFPCDMAPMGRQWFSLQGYAPEAMLAGVQAVAPALNDFLDQELARHGLDDGQLALIGFSQGTMTALHVALRRAKPCALVIGFSGALVKPELLTGELVSRPPVVLVHGEADPVVPFAALPAAEAALGACQVPVKSLARPGLGHGIDQEGLEFAALALRQHLIAAGAESA
ncbi:phospholipase [Pelagibius litoralis]|uniref:Phospholipase n=1 Tax=Pelagibius litoralis TaxID=374515 RepID=A0A967KBK3_9PROT|nr:alpha/beta fold hydrolase [Pelagibius litoralis]NIA71142.1 phospholipase [Pelagibius litoralis]